MRLTNKCVSTSYKWWIRILISNGQWWRHFIYSCTINENRSWFLVTDIICWLKCEYVLQSSRRFNLWSLCNFCNTINLWMFIFSWIASGIIRRILSFSFYSLYNSRFKIFIQSYKGLPPKIHNNRFVLDFIWFSLSELFLKQWTGIQTFSTSVDPDQICIVYLIN